MAGERVVSPMEARLRAYRPETDFGRIRDLLVSSYAAFRGPLNWDLSRWNWARYYLAHRKGGAAGIRFWEEATGVWKTCAGEIAGAVHAEVPRRGVAYVQRHPQAGYLLDEMIGYAEAVLAQPETGTLHLYVYDHDAELQAAAQRRGLQRVDDSMGVDAEIRIGDAPAVRLPPGYKVLSMAEEADVEARREVMGLAFGHPDPAGWPAAETFAELRRAPDYRPELDLLVSDGRGEGVAFCIVWYDAVNRFGTFEPVAVHPGFQRQGFGRAVVSEGLRRLVALGAERAYVGSDEAFYQAIRFRRAYTGHFWGRFPGQLNEGLAGLTVDQPKRGQAAMVQKDTRRAGAGAALASLARRWIEEGWQKGDVAVVDELHASHFVDRSSADRPPDREGFKAGIAALYAAFPDLHAEIEDLVVDAVAGKVAVRWSARGTHRGEFLGVAPTGRETRFQGIEILRVEEGLIVERWGEWDGLDLLEQLEEGTVNLSFESDGHRLAGLLQLPAGPPPYPAVVFCHGDGPATRDQYADWWQRIVDLGFACLAWDKPGVGQSTGKHAFFQSLAERADEVVAAIEHLRQRADIDPRRISLWGTSQGGRVLALAARQVKELAFAISVSCSGDTTWADLAYQIRLAASQLGLSPDTLERLLDSIWAGARVVEARGTYEQFIDAMQHLAPFWPLPDREAFLDACDHQGPSVHAGALLPSITCPLLAIWGTDDTYIDPAAARRVYATTLERMGHPDYTLVTLPGVDHGMRSPETGAVSAEYLATMEAWLAQRFGGGGAPESK